MDICGDTYLALTDEVGAASWQVLLVNRQLAPAGAALPNLALQLLVHRPCRTRQRKHKHQLELIPTRCT